MSANRLPISIRWVFPILALAAIIAIALASAGNANAEIKPVPCGANAVTQTPSEIPSTSKVDGQLITYEVFYTNPKTLAGENACDAENVTTSITTMNGTVFPVLNNETLNVDDVIICPADARCIGGDGVLGSGLPYTYTVLHTDEGGPVTSDCDPFTSDPNGNKISASFKLNGDLHKDDPDVSFRICKPLTTTVKHPPTIVTEIHDAGDNPITFDAVAPDTLVHDQALVTGLIPNVPITGSVDFVTYDTTTCTGNVLNAQSVAIDPNTGLAHPTIPDIAVPVGGLSFAASYAGDANYLEVLPDDVQCEFVTTVVSVELSTLIHEGLLNGAHAVINFGSTVADGTIVHDKATLTGNSGVVTGTVTITLHDNSTCSNATQFVDVVVMGVNDGGMAESTPVQIGTDTTGSNISYTASFVGSLAYQGESLSIGDANPSCEHLTERSVGGVTEFFATDSGTSYGLWAGYAAVAAMIVAVSVLFARRRLAR